MIVPYTSCLAGSELVPNLTKNTATVEKLGTLTLICLQTKIIRCHTVCDNFDVDLQRAVNTCQCVLVFIHGDT
jgi:hypothetical protein